VPHITSDDCIVNLYAEEGGDGADLLVLLHGLGATGAVWAPLLEVIGPRWCGRWFAPDLPGHGRSPPALRYSVEDAALAVGDALLTRASPAGRIAIVGQSLGTAIALALASGRFGVQPSIVFGVEPQLTWPDEELARKRSLAAQSVKPSAPDADAWERYLRAGKPAFAAFMADARCPVHLARAGRDPPVIWSWVEPYLSA
jgi:pimeloyl-ACP methyl ester carboxylesterase